MLDMILYLVFVELLGVYVAFWFVIPVHQFIWPGKKHPDKQKPSTS